MTELSTCEWWLDEDAVMMLFLRLAYSAPSDTDVQYTDLTCPHHHAFRLRLGAGKGKDIAVRNQNHHTATGNGMP